MYFTGLAYSFANPYSEPYAKETTEHTAQNTPPAQKVVVTKQHRYIGTNRSKNSSE